MLPILYRVAQPFQWLFHQLNRFLVWASTPFGVHITDTRRRYLRFLGIYAVIYLLGALPIPVLPLIALAVGYIGILAVSRAWVANEEERSLIAKKLKDGNPDDLPDLRWMALVSALQLLILFPLIFMQVQAHFDAYKIPEGSTFWVWVGFTLDSYNKAILNLFEVYGVQISHVAYDSIWGRHLMTLCRVTFDVLLLQGIYRLLAIRRTIQEAVAAVGKDEDLAVRLGRRAFEPLSDAFENELARLGVVKALGRLKDPRALPLLVVSLRHDFFLFRAEAASSLGRLGDRGAVEPLITALRDTHESVRIEAARAIGKLGDPRAVEPLLVALDDIDQDARTQAALALGELRDPRAVDRLITALADKHASVRGRVAEALGKLSDPSAVEPLITALKDESGNVRWQTAKALGELKDPRAVGALIAALQDANKGVRGSAANALGELKDSLAVEPLIAALQDGDQGVRFSAAWALGGFNDPRAVEPLKAALRDSDEDVHDAATQALGQLKDISAVEPLIASLRHRSDYLRRESAARLGDLNDPRAIEPLRALLKDSDKQVREAAALALERLQFVPTSAPSAN